MVGKVGNSLLSLLAITILIFAACEARNEWFLAENCWINSSFVVNSVRHSTQEHSENGLLHHLLYAPSLLNLMSKNIFKNIFVLVHTFVLDLWSFSSLRPFGGGSNLVVRPPFVERTDFTKSLMSTKMQLNIIVNNKQRNWIFNFLYLFQMQDSVL